MQFKFYITPLKFPALWDGCDGDWAGPSGTSGALWLPDALPGRSSGTSTAAAGGG